MSRDSLKAHGEMPWELFYDAEMYDEHQASNHDDIEFYLTEARRAGSPILELGAGTGRVCIEIVRDGYDVTALEIDPQMLSRGKANTERTIPPHQRKNMTWIQGNMTDFHLNRRFNLIIIPFRAFQHVLTPQQQMACLHCCREHLNTGGRLIIDLFDPKLTSFGTEDRLGIPFGTLVRRIASFRRQNGNEVVIYATRSENLTEQVFDEDWTLEEIDRDGKVVARRHRLLRLRWTYRFEMEHMLARCGFRVVSLLGDFRRGQFTHGGEQIWVAAPMGERGTDLTPSGTGAAV